MVKKVNPLNSSSHIHKCVFIITDTINSGSNTEKTFFFIKAKTPFAGFISA